MDSSYGRDSSEPPFDPAQPLKGVVVCCTSIPPDQRTIIASKTEELGGVHKYDLTPDVTHLIVGDYDTPKYRHVAKERIDIKAMDAGWVDAVGQRYMADLDVDFAVLEREWQLKPLETFGHGPDPENLARSLRGRLSLCMTGFDDHDERNSIIERIEANGGTYTGDLTKRVSHLIVRKAEGKKFKAARSWNIKTVSLAWLDQSIERGMILDEDCFDPLLPQEEQGHGAWSKVNPRRVSLGKRSRSAVGEDGQRKLRKTASMKLSSQRDTLWGDILGGNKPTAEVATPDKSEKIEVQDSGVHDTMVQPVFDAGIFSTSYFFMAGFDSWKAKILSETIGSRGGRSCATFDEMIAEADGTGSTQRFLIIPQASQPSTHFQVPPPHVDKIQIVTEFFVERCLHNKTLCDPNDHILGRPFPLFPIPGFEHLAICTAGFTGIDLLHVEKAIKQIGAKYAARFNEATSILVCKSVKGTRKEKLKFALDNDTPVVSADWLWDSIATGYHVPIKAFMFAELKQTPSLQPKMRSSELLKEQAKSLQRTHSEPLPHMPKRLAARHTSVVGIDSTAFQDDERRRPAVPKTTTAANTAASFQTARTHQMDSFGGGTVAAPCASSKSSPSQPDARSVANVGSKSVADSLEPTPIPVETCDEDDAPFVNLGDESVSAGEADGHDVSRNDLPSARAEEEVRVSATEEVETQHSVDGGAEEKAGKEARERACKEAERAQLTSKVISLIDTTNATTENQPRPRKKRGIMGRAVSNVSAGSNNSAESRIDAFGRTAEDQPPAEQHPPSTQIVYEDPGAEEHRAKIKRMRGETVDEPEKKQGDRLKLGGFEFDGDEGRPARRTRRKPGF
ncbi:S-M checkpoint control protein rad4 [Colletotrichum sidae]|uniref:S-M checkpoint control protein rad4 n=1 Tax=Colletotrichum sidae TaxID=1347389 RepID=A0A4R8TA75_9PEZI|nr:S-M checkpoint control protein rad4 [Colletotrichum sidae]